MRQFIGFDAIIEILDNGFDEDGSLILNPSAAAAIYKWVKAENAHVSELQKEAQTLLHLLKHGSYADKVQPLANEAD